MPQPQLCYASFASVRPSASTIALQSSEPEACSLVSLAGPPPLLLPLTLVILLVNLLSLLESAFLLRFLFDAVVSLTLTSLLPLLLPLLASSLPSCCVLQTQSHDGICIAEYPSRERPVALTDVHGEALICLGGIETITCLGDGTCVAPRHIGIREVFQRNMLSFVRQVSVAS